MARRNRITNENIAFRGTSLIVLPIHLDIEKIVIADSRGKEIVHVGFLISLFVRDDDMHPGCAYHGETICVLILLREPVADQRLVCVGGLQRGKRIVRSDDAGSEQEA